MDYINTIKASEHIRDKQVSSIDTEQALLAPARITQIVAYIREHFDQKTRRTTFYSHKGKRLSGFNSLFATASIEAAKRYYLEFSNQQKKLPPTRRLKVGLIDQKDIDKFLMIGDKVLIKPKNPQSQTKTGLYLPPSVQQGEKIQAGYIIKTGPGYPLPSQSEEHEVWEKKKGEEVQYLPLQAREGDLAVYLQNAAYEINFNDEKFLIVPHSAILMLVRDEGLFE